MEKQQLPNAKCHSQQQHSRQPQQQCRNHRPQTINIVVNIGAIIMPVNVTKGKKEGEQPSQFDQLVNEVIAAGGKKLQQQ